MSAQRRITFCLSSCWNSGWVFDVLDDADEAVDDATTIFLRGDNSSRHSDVLDFRRRPKLPKMCFSPLRYLSISFITNPFSKLRSADRELSVVVDDVVEHDAPWLPKSSSLNDDEHLIAPAAFTSFPEDNDDINESFA